MVSSIHPSSLPETLPVLDFGACVYLQGMLLVSQF